MHRIKCSVLFNVTQTGVMNRNKPMDIDIDSWIYKRNTQCNFDTILQIISLRSQPEVIKIPTKIQMTSSEFKLFGSSYKYDSQKVYFCWTFEFEVQHSSVFADNIANPLAALYRDCEDVPMIICEGQYNNTTAFLKTSPELKNIHFEVINETSEN